MVLGIINAIGSKDCPISFSAENISWNGFKIYKNSTFKFCKFLNIPAGTGEGIFENPEPSYLDIENCLFRDDGNKIMWLSFESNHMISKSVFTDNLNFSFTNNHSFYNYKSCNIIRNNSFVEMAVSPGANFFLNNIFFQFLTSTRLIVLITFLVVESITLTFDSHSKATYTFSSIN